MSLYIWYYRFGYGQVLLQHQGEKKYPWKLLASTKSGGWGLYVQGGSLAEYAVASIKTTAKRPDEISATDAAPLGVGGTTALQTIRDSAGIKFDGSNQVTKNVLITAASGGVGTYAVQVPPVCLCVSLFISLEVYHRRPYQA
jgi:NADPH:quinone reductase-like Zn-dependent oxidoreductase